MPSIETALTLESADEVERFMKFLSPRWTTSVLIQLASGKKRNRELLKALEPISAKVLAERLSTLLKCGLIERRSYGEVPPRVEYNLTEVGRELLDLLESIKFVSKKMPEQERNSWGNQSLRDLG